MRGSVPCPVVSFCVNYHRLQGVCLKGLSDVLLGVILLLYFFSIIRAGFLLRPVNLPVLRFLAALSVAGMGSISWMVFESNQKVVAIPITLVPLLYQHDLQKGCYCMLQC